MYSPPLSAGAVQRTIANPLPNEVAVTEVGALGAEGATTFAEGSLSPIALVATMVKV
jgi:hypothetical protein